MDRSRLITEFRWVVPPDRAEIAAADSGWRRVGFLQRLVKVARKSEVSAADESRAVRSERARRRAA